MNEDFDVVEVFLVHPTALSDEDIKEIENKATAEFIKGDLSFARCIVVAYVDWLEVEGLRARSH